MNAALQPQPQGTESIASQPGDRDACCEGFSLVDQFALTGFVIYFL